MSAPRKYCTTTVDTNTVNTTVGGLTSATTIRPSIYDIVIGSEATPADQAARFIFQRYTVAGTSTAVTPQALDPADPASLLAVTTGQNHSAEPTYTANAIMLPIALNQRATYRWVAAPGGEIVMPATAANGIGCQAVVVTSAYAVTVGWHHAE